MRQSSALNILKTGQNVFLTGSAGSGKTYTLNQYIDYLRARRVPVAVTASTGIAATHMNGTTIHSWSGIGIKDELSDRDLTNLSRKQFLADRLKDTAVLIIDEISMLHAKQLNLVNQVLKHVRKNDAAFGGIQVVVAGDFFQLPPIGSKGESNREKFAFMSEAWLDAKFHICYLSEQHRQVSEAANGGLDLDDILNQIRRQEVTFEAIAALEATFDQNVDINRTRLYTHNLNVNKINDKELAALEGETMRFEATATGDSKLVETLKKTVRTQDELILKVGAKVMFIKNNTELGVSNGTMGELINRDHVTWTHRIDMVFGRTADGAPLAVDRGMAYVSKDRDKESIVLQASIQSNILMPALKGLSGALGFISPAKERALTNQQIKVMSIKCRNGSQLVKELSGGNKQKVVFSKWLGTDCDVFILDCPTRGIDVGVKADMYKLIMELKRQGKGIIMISEELLELIGMSDRMMIFKDGKVSKEFARSADLKENDIIEYII